MTNLTLENLYKEVILDHYRNPRNRAPLADVDRHADGNNPLCGDKISVDLQLEGDTVESVAIHGQGCSISQASASLMSVAIKGKTLAEIELLHDQFSAMMMSETTLDPDRPGAVLGEIEALAGVKAFPVRIKCASLPWATLASAVDGASDDEASNNEASNDEGTVDETVPPTP